MLAGDPARAAATIRTAHKLTCAQAGWAHHLIVDVLPRMAIVFEALGDVDGLACVVGDLKKWHESRESELPLLTALVGDATGRLHAISGDVHAATELGRLASEQYGVLGYRWRQALALQHTGEMAARTGEHTVAIEALESAYREFEAMGAGGAPRPDSDRAGPDRPPSPAERPPLGAHTARGAARALGRSRAE